MKSFFKRALIVSAAALFVAGGLTGCFGKGGDGKFDLAEEPEDVKEISIFKNDWPQFNAAKQANTPIYQRVTSAIGCDINAINGAETTYFTQLKLRQIDDDLPEIFMTEGVGNPQLLMNLIEEGDILPISDYASEEKYPNLYKRLQDFDFLKKNLSYAQGKLWYFPARWENEKSMYVRKDWIDNLNGKLDSILVADGIVASAGQVTPELRTQWRFRAPDTLLEFYRLARAFTIYDPDNNGDSDTYGYMSCVNPTYDAWIYAAFDSAFNQYVPDGAGGYTTSNIS
ncbi:MAG: hypothetical protein LBL66_01460, partial [Clostridiales bacterium]|nr:hypothetical protein [Clostridiales bacterium]